MASPLRLGSLASGTQHVPAFQLLLSLHQGSHFHVEQFSDHDKPPAQLSLWSAETCPTQWHAERDISHSLLAAASRI